MASQDTERKSTESVEGASQGAKVYRFPDAAERVERDVAARNAHPTLAELEEYRQMLPMLRTLLKEFPALKRKVEEGAFVDEHSMLAQAILKGER